MPRFRQTKEILSLMSRKDRIRNVGIVAHIDHGKTTLTDSLLASAGLLPRELAGSARVLDYLKEEQQRGITIKSANISLLHKIGGQSYVVNLEDTPGHVDFTGRVTRALRAIDGAIVVVDAVEEVMSQTETVVRQALNEMVRPVLFINKVDRLVKELRLTTKEIQAKFRHIITDFNNLIQTYAEEEFASRWKADPADSSVVFGSAIDKWAISFEISKDKQITFSHVLDAYDKKQQKALARTLPLSQAVLNMIVKMIPNPREAQKYRIPAIWNGRLESDVGKAMLNCDDKGPLAMSITNIRTGKEGQTLATARVFSGTAREGKKVYIVNAAAECTISQISIGMGASTDVVSEIDAGNIAVFKGLDQARAGETVIDPQYREMMVPFEKVRYVTEPVITVAVEPKNPHDLSKLAEVMNRLQIEDPNVKTTLNRETGEYLLSGMGELHLEIAVKTLREYTDEKEIAVSKPSVNYRETVVKRGKAAKSQSSNKENQFTIRVQPSKERIEEKDDSTWVIDENENELVDLAENSPKLNAIKESVISGFQWACNAGPLSEQPMKDVKTIMLDASISDDPQKRETTQIAKAVSRAIFASFLTAKPTLLEPVYRIEITVPPEFVGECSKIATHRRAKITILQQKNSPNLIIKGFIPVAESFGLATELRSATSGRAFWQSRFDHWAKTPKPIAAEVIAHIRGKKGLQQQIPKPEDFAEIESAS
jgi:elongation factor 2